MSEHKLNHGDYTLALSELGVRCDAMEMIPAKGIIFTKHGSSVLYGCSRSGPNPCSSSELGLAMDVLDKTCGQDVVGWVNIARWRKKYGRNTFNGEACGHSLNNDEPKAVLEVD